MIYAPVNQAIPEEWIRSAWGKNHDGAGYMFAVDGTLHVRKPFWKLADLLAAYQADHKAYGALSAFVLHLRWSTHGKENAHNTHPHVLDNGRAGLAHNGILSDFEPPWKSDLSDTAFFCGTVLSARPAEQLLDDHFGKVLAEMIGPDNKFALMDCAGNVAIVNQNQGDWDGDFWVSNHGHVSVSVAAPKVSIAQPIARGITFTDQDKLPAKYQGGLWANDVDTDWERFHQSHQSDSLDEYNYAIAELEYMQGIDLDTLTPADFYAIANAAERAGDALEDDAYASEPDDDDDPYADEEEAEHWLREQQRIRGIEVP
jgi:hypothetical protein